MSYYNKTTQQWYEEFLATYNDWLGSNVSLMDRSYIEVQASTDAALALTIQQRAAFEAKEGLAISASRQGLEILAANYQVPIVDAKAATFLAEIEASDGVSIPKSRAFTAESSGEKYIVTGSNVANNGVCIVELSAKELGTVGNLDIGEMLTISALVQGAASVAIISQTQNIGTEAESESSIRQKILDRERSSFGGGNLADYRKWAESVLGVRRAFPFTGPPEGQSQTPPWRSVFIEAQENIEPNGIAPQALIDSVRQAIRFDSNGQRQESAGNSDQFLIVQSITKQAVFIRVGGLKVTAENEGAAKLAVEKSLKDLIDSTRPYIQGLDPLRTKQNTITKLNLGDVVQSALDQFGATATGLDFGLTNSSTEQELISIKNNLYKLEMVSYV